MQPVNMDDSFLWFDLETFGKNPRYDLIAQIAAVRTDSHLMPLGDPVVWYCQPTYDKLPSPEACLITGITPQHAHHYGMPEGVFAEHIFQLFTQSGTCGVGYNSLAFDDEFLRHLFYRNLIEPYTREYHSGNSRWDFLNVMRAVYVLRPEGLNWPINDDKVSLKLTDLTAVNGIAHEHAHDALADVEATIALARLVQKQHPRLYDYLLKHRSKQQVLRLLKTQKIELYIHVAATYGRNNNYLGVIIPLVLLGNEYLALNVNEELTKDTLPFVRIAINRCPVLADITVLRQQDIERLHLNPERWQRNKKMIVQNLESYQRQAQDWATYPEQEEYHHPDASLYTGSFLTAIDKIQLNKTRQQGSQISTDNLTFEDHRLAELVFLYKARNFSENLTEQEQQRWQKYLDKNLQQGVYLQSTSLQDYKSHLQILQQTSKSAGEQQILTALQDYLQKHYTTGDSLPDFLRVAGSSD